MTKKYFLILIILIVTEQLHSQTFHNTYDAHYDFDGENGYSDNYNEFAWNESRYMESYLAIFRATNDIKYLDILIRHAKNVIDLRDDNVTPQRIQWNLSSATATWSLNNPTYTGAGADTNYYAFIVHSGMIYYPIADFAQLVLRNSSLQTNTYTPTSQTYLELANEFVSRITETINVFNSASFWSDTTEFGLKSGLFRERNVPDNWGMSLDNRYSPINMQLAIGRTLLMMYVATNNSDYLDKVERLANRFKARLWTSNGYYLWLYWKGYQTTLTDIGHGGLSSNFAYLCYKNGIVFT